MIPDGDYVGPRARLFYIDRMLREGRFPTKRRMAEQLGVNAKTIQRDLTYLRENLDAPVEFDETRQGWHYTDPTFFLPAALVTEEDILLLALARQALTRHECPPLGELGARAFKAILATIPPEERDRADRVATRIAFAGFPSAGVDTRTFQTLLDAVDERRAVLTTYRSHGEDRELRLEPWGFIVVDGDWFVHAHSEAHGGRRTFYLPRVVSARLLAETFQVPDDFSIAEYARTGFKGLQTEGGALHEVTLRFTPEGAAAEQERPWSRDQTQRREPDGSLVLAFRTTALFQVAREVLQRGSAVEVLAPEELRERVAAELRAAAAVYHPAGR